jgi:hypothetical protein
MPPRNTLSQPYSQFKSTSEMVQAISRVLKSIDGVTIVSMQVPNNVLVNAASNTWSRAARRRKLAIMDAVPSNSPKSTSPALTCCIRCVSMEADGEHGTHAGQSIMEFNWVQGRDRGLFESFMSHVARKVELVAKHSNTEATRCNF